MDRPSPLALVTGASSGIGAASARRLAQDGFRVILAARSADRLAEVAAGIGPGAAIEAVDLADAEAVDAMAARVIESHGVPDVLIHSAGAGAWRRIEETAANEAQTMMDAPYFAAFNVNRAFLPHLLERDSGVIIHVGSPASYAVWPSSAGYAAARWALRGLHEALCADLIGTGVRSCHVMFGRVDSPYFTTNAHTVDRAPRAGDLVRTISPAEAARVIARLARRPRRDVAHPAMLKVLAVASRLAPGLVRRIATSGGWYPKRG